MKTSFLKKAAGPFERLFWRAQIGVLRACPPLCGVVSGASMGAANSRAVWTKTLLRVAARTPRAVLQHWEDRRRGRVVLPRASIIATMRCTLNCEKCIGRMPDLKSQSHRDAPTPELLRDIQSLFSCVDYIYTVIFSGGEPFLHPDLGEFLRACAASGKAGGISVFTNGTVVPGEKTLAALKETKAAVKISSYGPGLQPHVEALKAALEGNGIPYTHESGTFWHDLGAFGQPKEGSAQRRFSVCHQNLCLVCYQGRLHLCGESALLAEEGLIPACREDSIDLRAVSPAEFRGQWRRLLKKRAVAACSYCLGTTYKTPRIPVAVQRPENANGMQQRKG